MDTDGQAYALPSLAVVGVLIAPFFIGPALGEDRVGAWQRAMLLLAFAWQISVALHLRAELAAAPEASARDEPKRAIG